MDAMVYLKTPLKRIAFIAGGLILAIATSEIVHAIYIAQPYDEWNGMLQLFWLIIMFVAIITVGYGLILKK